MAKKRNMEEFFATLLEKLGEYYETKLESGEFPAADQKCLIQLLKDNNITIDPASGAPIEGLLDGDFSGLEEMFKQ